MNQKMTVKAKNGKIVFCILSENESIEDTDHTPVLQWIDAE